MAFVTKLTIGFLTFSKIVNKGLLLVENTPHGQKSFQVSRYITQLVTFLTYINDLPNIIHSSIRLFADDCVLHREIKNESDSQELQKDLDSLMKWEYDWQMHFNSHKNVVMRLTHAKRLTRFNYLLGDKSLQETDNHPSRSSYQ